MFGGFSREYEECDYIILGVPLDCTSTFRPGSRFAPSQIRLASANIETYSFMFSIDVEEVRVGDVGDIDVSGGVKETVERVREVTRNLVADGKTPVLIGGEHTLTLGSVRAFNGKVGVVCFDAHLDLRDEFLGLRVSHATFMRRVCESIGPENVMVVGARAAPREEVMFAEGSGMNVIKTLDLKKRGLERVGETIREFAGVHDKTYVSIDMDVLDPSIAPAVQNPEPGGLLLNDLMMLLTGGCAGGVSALDLVEVTPIYDSGI
ncbi:MAG: agmatinase, partial [Candidatus Bathyarchaeia archaeon]